MVSQMWLPLDVCQAFERSFNLTWNATAELYLLTEGQHAALLAQNTTFTFSIGSSSSGGESAKIQFPYAAFDLSVGHPLVESETRYFPLKRALNSSQYTLGRVFLQEAYVIADYDRRNFSVSQAVIPERGAQQIVAIDPPGLVGEDHKTDNLRSRDIIGIAVGAFIALVLLIATMVYFRRRKAVVHPILDLDKSDRGNSIYRKEDVAPGERVEMSAMDSVLFEPDSRRAFPPELAASITRRKSGPHELGVGEVHAVELEAPCGR